jgi:hypothetical protein
MNEEELEKGLMDELEHKGTFLKAVILLSISFLSFGSFFAYDSISVVEYYLSKVFRMS